MAKPDTINRREFLNYAWLSAMALMTVQTGGVGILFAFPRFKGTVFGAKFELGQAQDVLPPPQSKPIPYDQGKFWLVNTDDGVLAIYKVCTHLGCLYEWSDIDGRFECPCHGSRFALDGTFLEGPAPRSLDRFIIEAANDDGTLLTTDAEGNALPVLPESKILVDTGKRIKGQPAKKAS